jgi:hypothetical protein
MFFLLDRGETDQLYNSPIWESDATLRTRSGLMKKSKIDPEEIVLSGSRIAELKTQAARKGCTLQELTYKISKRAIRKGPKYLAKCARKVDTMWAARMVGKDVSSLWSLDINEYFVERSYLQEKSKEKSEEALLQLSGQQMDRVERLCRERGITFEEWYQEAIYLSLHEPPPGRDEEIVEFLLLLGAG